MKTFIIGMFSLALVASSAAWGAQHRPPVPPSPGPLPKPGIPAICNWTNGIIIIVLTQTGDIEAVACKNVGAKTIKYKPLDPNNPNVLPVPAGMKLKVEGSLGKVLKYKFPNEADPCVTWVIGGTSYTYCW
ncbi:MAG: hypothetical protein O7G83_13460 [Proteobacteria bacterium]|nr:hypothetical protein [Pseudomonadota bacterium]